MKNMKNILNMTLCAMLAASALVSCGGSGGSSSETASTGGNSGSNSNSSSTSDTVNSDVIDEITLPISENGASFNIWTVWSNNYIESLNDNEAVQLMEEKTGVHIEYTCVPSDAATEKFGLLLVSDSLPDAIYLGEDSLSYPGGGDKAIDDGTFIDLKDYVETYMPNYRAYRNSDELVSKMTLTDQGRMYYIPMLRSDSDANLSPEPAWVGLTIRQDWLDDLGLKAPETIAEWETVLTAFKEEKGAEAPLMIGPTGTIFTEAFTSAYGVTSTFFLKEDGTVGYGPMEEGYREWIELYRDWYAKGLIDPNFISNSANMVIPTEYGATGKTGAGSNIWGLTRHYYYEVGSSDDPDLDFVAIKAPTLNKGDTAQYKFVSYAVSNKYVVTSACKDVPTLLKWMDYQYTREGMLINAYGTEGKTYTMENDEPIYTDMMIHPSDDDGYLGVTSGDRLAVYARGDGVGLVPWDRWDQAYAQDKRSGIYVWHADGTDLALPQITMTEAEGNEYNMLFAQIQTLVQEKTVAYIMGTESMDTYDDFLSTLSSMNVERCIEIKQAALDRYNAR